MKMPSVFVRFVVALLVSLLLAHQALADASLPPVVLWYAPFLSGGGYCSEAHSYVTSIAAAVRARQGSKDHAVESSRGADASVPSAQEDQSASGGEKADDTAYDKPFALRVTQHGDSLNAGFIRDIPDDMRELLEEVLLLSLPPLTASTSLLLRACTRTRSRVLCDWTLAFHAALTALSAHVQHWIEPRDFHWRLRDQTIAIAICHSEPGAWHPARYSTSRCPPAGAQYKVGRTMFETDRVPNGWAERMNTMDEIWVPTKYVSGCARVDQLLRSWTE